MRTALVLFNSPWNLGIEGDKYLKTIRVYNNESDALMAYAETPCSWSELVKFTTEEELNQKVAEIENNLNEGKYDDYM